MATKPDAAKPAGEEAAKSPAKSKKMLVIGAVAVLVLALGGGGAWFYMAKKKAAEEDVEEVVHAAPKGPPTFLPLDNMVVNLADPGGERVAQVGITLELNDPKGPDKVKVYLPSIRSGILLLISQRTAEELLLIEGKEKLAADILREASRPFVPAAAAEGKQGKEAKEGETPKKKAAAKDGADDNPVKGVHFSSFIVQ